MKGRESMEKWMTCKEAAFKWNLTERWVSQLCKSGKIPGAVKKGKRWEIPHTAVQPEDTRIKTGKYKKTVSSFKTLPLPIGISDYCKASTEYYYVDKTLLIKDFLDQKPFVSLFTRPRRFGKTLNMDMLRVFFEKTDSDTSIYFKDKNIWKCGEDYRQHQGHYPVIFLTFKDVKYDSWNETFEKLKELFQKEYGRHKELATSSLIADFERKYYEKILSGNASKVELSSALSNLSQMLHEHHGIAPIIIIDEYDTPIQQGHAKNYYDDIILFMRNLFSGGFKDNPHLSYGFLTGILRIAQESIFSGMNNLKVNSVLEERYSSYFGFTPEEVKAMAAYYGCPDKYPEICEWYDGYRFGNQEIFNPWSVIGYFDNNCKPDTFWISTGSNEILSDILAVSDEDILERLNSLLRGEKILTQIDMNVVYPQLEADPSYIYSFLLVAGYLKADSSVPGLPGTHMCEVSIPNKEILSVYKKEILAKLIQRNSQLSSSAYRIQRALFSNDVQLLQDSMQNFLYQTISFYDSSHENFYQGLLAGLLALTDNMYYVTSNRESGSGRYDFQLKPKSRLLPGIIIEIKVAKKETEQQLTESAKNALQQIEQKQYCFQMEQEGISPVFCYGIAFCGKQVKILQR